MIAFAVVLEYYREQAGLSRAELATLIAKTPQFVAALESRNKPKQPSLETLHDLIPALATRAVKGPIPPKASPEVWSWKVAVDLALSAIGLDVPAGVPVTLAEELADQAGLSEGTKIWILTDLLAEAESQEFARQTADNTLKGIEYSYFVPFSMDESHWRRAVDSIRRLRKSSTGKLDDALTMYQISNCAFPCRLRISNPLHNERKGTYGLGWASARAHFLFYPAPRDLLHDTVRVLGELIGQLSTGPTRPDGICGNERLGFIRQLFPARKVR